MNASSTAVPTRLSACALWRLQREYFARTGIDVWRRNTCPSYVTTNPFIAETYARLVHAHLADAGPALGDGEVHVLELGGGSGRFAHHFLESFHALAPGARARYVLSDVARANVDFWREHPKLRPWIERGQLDVMQLGADATGATDDLRLEVSGRPLRPGPGGRLVVIANYVFDSIEQDAFAVQHGLLWEGHVTLAGATGEGASWLEALELRPRFVHVPGPAYEDPLWTRILEDHRVLPDGAFLFPVGALASLARLRELSGGELLVLSADKGCVRLPELAGQPFPALVKHGSFSFTVNYHALGEWVRASGGVTHEPPAFGSIAVVAYAFGAAKEGPALRRAYERDVVDFGPDDYFSIKRATELRMGELDLDALLALLRLSRWDVNVFASCYPRLLEVQAGASSDQRHALRDGLLRAWSRYLPIGEEYDAAFQLGCVLASLGCYDEAAGLFRASLASHGDDPQTRENLARCLARDAT